MTTMTTTTTDIRVTCPFCATTGVEVVVRGDTEDDETCNIRWERDGRTWETPMHGTSLPPGFDGCRDGECAAREDRAIAEFMDELDAEDSRPGCSRTEGFNLQALNRMQPHDLATRRSALKQARALRALAQQVADIFPAGMVDPQKLVTSTLEDAGRTFCDDLRCGGGHLPEDFNQGAVTRPPEAPSTTRLNEEDAFQLAQALINLLAAVESEENDPPTFKKQMKDALRGATGVLDVLKRAGKLRSHA